MRIIPAITLLLLLPCAAPAATEAQFYVACDGNDAWSGTLVAPHPDKSDGPVASVARAQALVRALLAREPGRQTPVVVAVRGGTYYLQEPVTFTPADSGTPSAPVIYRAHGDERPVLSGGVRIGGWTAAGGRWTAQLDGVKQGRWSFAQLFVNDQRRFRPRLPNRGYYEVAGAAAPSPTAQGHNRFVYPAGSLHADWANLGDVEVVAFHRWSASRMRIAALDEPKRIVEFTGATQSRLPWAEFPKGNRFLVENVREALDQPGQWYLDRPRGALTYLPRGGETPEKTVVVAPRLERLVTFQGDAGAKRFVHDIRLEGLTLAHANWTLPPHGHSCPQAEVTLPAAVEATAARNVVLQRCAVRHVGGYAIAFGPGCRDNRVEDCELVDLGGGGIKIGQSGISVWGKGPPAAEDAASHHVVRNCRIAHGGRLQPAAVGVWIGHSPHNTIAHNDIFDFYYTGVSVGWIWGYHPSHAQHNDIGFNHIHTIGQGVLSDMGGIYTLGPSHGTVLHDNHIHDVRSLDYGGWGLYTDEGSHAIRLANNLVYRTKSGGFHQHYGSENVVENNIFAFGERQQIERTRVEPHLSYTFRRNIVYWTRGPLVQGNWTDGVRQEQNLYWAIEGGDKLFPGGRTLAQWQQTGRDQGSKVADPGFANPQGGDFHLDPGSPAIALGFKPFDYTQAGRRGAAVLTKDLPPAPRGFE